MTSQSKILKKILRSDLCTGCGICSSLSHGKVAMDIESSGYLRPQQMEPLDKDEDDAIQAVCPGISLKRPVSNTQNHLIWGPYETARLGWSTDPKLRFHGSSGGALSAIANYLIESGTVEFVLNIGVSDERPLDNDVKISRTTEDIFKTAGSRYSPSAPLTDLSNYLDGDARFAIIAKPCDIAAVRKLAKLDPRVDKMIPVLLSFFCAGIPSRLGTLEILKALGVDEENITQFKYRGDGWPGKSTAVTKSGKTKSMSYSDSWGGILSKHIQFRCKICPDGSGAFADIVCADAWHSDEKGYPIFEDVEGRSLVMARTRAGEAIVTAASEQNFIDVSDFDLKELTAMQPGQFRRSQALLARLLAFPFRARTIPSYRGFHMIQNARKAGLWNNVRNFLGTLRRI